MLLLDTNIVIGYIRKDVSCPPERFISIITVGELKAFAIISKWGTEKQLRLNNYLKTLQVLDIDEKISSIYAEIDAFSQGLHPEKSSVLPPVIWVKMIFGLLQQPIFLIFLCKLPITISVI